MNNEINIDFFTLYKTCVDKGKLEQENNDLKFKLVQEKARADRFMLYVLDAHYSDWMLSKEHLKERKNITSACFGLCNVEKLFEMGITHEQMIDYIERKDAEILTERKGCEDEPRF